MTDVPEGPTAATPEEEAAAVEEHELKKILFEAYLRFVKTSTQGGASSSNVFQEPEKDKKPPKKKNKESNKKLDASKKKLADLKAKYLKTVKEKKELELLAKLEKREKLAQKRKSLLQKDEEKIQLLKEKLNDRTSQ